MKKKIIILVILIVSTLFISGITYSKFNSKASLISDDEKIASFVFDGKKTDNINISLDELKPGDLKDYNFTVSNNNENYSSDVTLNYTITIKTYHFIPLNINLYKEENNKSNLVLTCDETYSRNEENALVCNSDVFEMVYNEKINDNYRLNISFPQDYNDSSYSNITDYIDIEIKSWQK